MVSSVNLVQIFFCDFALSFYQQFEAIQTRNRELRSQYQLMKGRNSFEGCLIWIGAELYQQRAEIIVHYKGSYVQESLSCPISGEG